MSRQFPTQYSSELQKVILAISIGTPNIVGSSVQHEILYSADFDMMESLQFKRNSPAVFQRKIKQIQKIGAITDIKCGEVTEWNLLKRPHINKRVKNYSQKNELEHLNYLWQSKIITQSEYDLGKSLLKPSLTMVEFLNARKELRFGLLRWTPKEVLQGYKEFRERRILLEDAMKSKGITKVDVIAWVNTKYIEFSNIILWRSGGKYYAEIPNIKRALAEDIKLFESEGNYVKVAKRMLNIAMRLGNQTTIDTIIDILNGPIGKLYAVTSDLEVLSIHPKPVPAKKRKQLDLMHDEFAKLFFPELSTATPKIALLPKLREILQENMKITLQKHKLLPVPKIYNI